MKRILLIEDNGDLSNDIEEALQDLGFEIKHAGSYLSAKGMWKKYKGEFNAILLDLNINPEGLEPKRNSDYFPINSLPFMLDIGWDSNMSEKVKVIVYSGYVDDFKKVCAKFNIPNSSMTIFDKSGTNLSKLINFIKENV